MLAFLALALFAQAPPNLLHFQARIADAGGNALAGSVSLQVLVYDVPVGGAALWSETQSVTALNGVVNLVLGSVAALPSTLFDGTRYLALRVGADPEMTPRRQIVAAPFARRAASVTGLDAATTIPTGLITSTHILDGTIASADLANSAVTSAKLGTGAVTSTAILDGTIATADLANLSVSLAKLAANSVDGSKVVDGSITAADLAAGAVGSAALASASVGSAAIIDSSVGAAEIAGNAVTSAKILDGTITPSDLANPLLAVFSPGIRMRSTIASGTALLAEALPSSGSGTGIQGTTSGTGGAGVIGDATGTSGTCDGVRASTTSPSGYGVWARATSLSGFGNGVVAETQSPGGVGVSGSALASSGQNVGVYGYSNSYEGNAVHGFAANSTGLGFHYGVRGEVQGGAGDGVYGITWDSGSGSPAGVRGEANGPFSIGVMGESPKWGVYGQSDATTGGYGAQGTANGTSSYGVFGSVSSSTSFGVYSAGNFGGSGNKYFIQPHPTDPSREIRFVCLEGNESGTYCRGTAELKNGAAVIEVPEEFRLASSSANLSAQLTPTYAKAGLWVESQDLEKLVVRGERDGRFHWVINGLRRGFEQHEPIVANMGFVPQYRGVPYGTQYPEALRGILVANGILNPDFTPNEATAAKFGWSLRDASQSPAEVAKRSREQAVTDSAKRPALPSSR